MSRRVVVTLLRVLRFRWEAHNTQNGFGEQTERIALVGSLTSLTAPAYAYVLGRREQLSRKRLR